MARSQKAPLYGETLQTTGFYVGRVVIVPREFATILPAGIILKLQSAFLRHAGIYLSDGGSNPQPGEERRLPPAAPHPSLRHTPGGTRSPHRPDEFRRLFLDRVGRHQRPSPLHRHTQINMHSSQATAKGDVSTLLRRGHFYFALTRPNFQLVKIDGSC